jgi:hypothetical protein
MKRRLSALAALIALALLPAAGDVLAQEPARSWTEEKCVRYGAAWTNALARLGREGLGDALLADHEEFLACGG